MNSAHRIIRNLLLVSLPSLLLFVLFAEMLFRWVPFLEALTADPTRIRTPYQYGDATLFAPNLDTRVDYLTGSAQYTFRTNAFGLRSRQVPQEAPRGTLRILCVGDSYTEGFGVNQEETFPNRMDELLNASGVPSEVLCAGKAGTHIWDYVDIVHHFGDLLNPDILILAVYSGNDIEPTMLEAPGREGLVSAYGFLVPPEALDGFRANLTFGSVYFRVRWVRALDLVLWRSLRSYRWVSDRVAHSCGAVRFLSRLGLVSVRPRIEPPERPVLNMDTDLYLNRNEAPADVGRMYGSAERAFSDIVQYCRDRGVRLLVLNIPEGWQNPVWSFRAPAFTRRHDRNRVHDFWTGLNARYGVASVDLKPIYSEAWSRQTYTVFDLGAPHGHFSPTDNALVAFVLLDKLMRQGWVSVDKTRLAREKRARFPDLILPYEWAKK